MLDFFNKYIFGICVPIALTLAGIYYFFLLRGFHITKIKTILKTFKGNKNREGTSPAKALMLALAGTLGVGNIVGVSAAIYLGGFGAIFWMWISAFLAMLLKYAEILLAIKYRSTNNNGAPHGSAMMYIRNYFTKANKTQVGKLVAGFFAVMCIINSLSMGSVIQINAVSDSFDSIFGVSPIICCGILAIISFIVISKGSTRIMNTTERIVPIMSVGYVILSLAVIIIKRDELFKALMLIFKGAFKVESGFGGIAGFVLSRSIRFGVMRGLISNEAGCGTAPCAHATANTKSPVEQGFYGIIEVFVDTILLCTMTGLTVILSYSDVEHFGDNFIMMTIKAYSIVLGKWVEYFLAIAVLLFAFATVICWAHYGFECCNYFDNKRRLSLPYTIIYIACIFASPFFNQSLTWEIADFSIGAMTLINVTMLFLMSKEVKKETELYFNIKSTPK